MLIVMIIIIILSISAISIYWLQSQLQLNDLKSFKHLCALDVWKTTFNTLIGYYKDRLALRPYKNLCNVLSIHRSTSLSLYSLTTLLCYQCIFCRSIFYRNLSESRYWPTSWRVAQQLAVTFYICKVKPAANNTPITKHNKAEQFFKPKGQALHMLKKREPYQQPMKKNLATAGDEDS